MHPHVLAYSLVEGIKKHQLKSGEYEPVESAALEKRMQNHAVSGCLIQESNYHFKFHSIQNSPSVYYRKGTHEVLHKPMLGIVGPRMMSEYAKQVLKKLFEELSTYDIATVSGMAPGVDSLCHELSLSYQIPTVAVLGGGLGYFLKSNKRHMIEKITDHGGLVISECKLGQVPTVWTYPQRNRIIAGLVECLFVPEAKRGSGSLITVENALSLHNPVYGAPQSLFTLNSQGLLGYMQSGLVTPVVDLDWFLHKEFGEWKKTEKKDSADHSIPESVLSTNQERISGLLKQGKKGVDVLSEMLGWDIGHVMGELTVMEMMEVVREEQGKYVLC